MRRRVFLRYSAIGVTSLSGCGEKFLGQEKEEDVTSTPKPKVRFDATAPESFTESERKSLESRVHDLVNRKRRKYGFEPLKFNEDLAYIARTHSRDMAINGYFAHTEPDGDGLRDRLEEYGYNWEHTSENIVKPSTNPDITISLIAERAVSQWMNSPPHREQILVPSYNLEGIGAYVKSHYSIYITQIFDE